MTCLSRAPPKLLFLTTLVQSSDPSEWVHYYRERERDGIEGSHTSPRTSPSQNPNPNRTEVAAMGFVRFFPPVPLIARWRSSLQRRGHRKSPLRHQELPQSRSLSGQPLVFPFPFSQENSCLVRDQAIFYVSDFAPQSINIFFFFFWYNKLKNIYRLA